MKYAMRFNSVVLLAGLFAIYSSARAEQDPSKDTKGKAPMEARALLEKGKASGSLPEGMVVRLAACLGEAEANASGGEKPDNLYETWEFTANQVHRVVYESKEGKSGYRRVDSRPFDSKDICKELLDGKAIEILARKGEGPNTAFVGSVYRRGSRRIDVEWKGESILDLHETNGAALHLYRETDARAFGALYERLAGQARVLFKSNTGETK
jgi:hypothetical protein